MRITLKKNKDKYLRRGHPWVFANLIAEESGDPGRGDVVEIADHSGDVLGKGLYHDESLIAVRFLTADAGQAVDDAFFRQRIERALALRRQVYGDATHYRLAFSESDGLPGTIIDRYGDVLTWTTLSYGMDARREGMLDALEDLLHPTAIIQRDDAPLREKDGLEQAVGVLRGSYDGPVEIVEDDVTFVVDVLHGPKTGFFLDQRDHRRSVRRFAAGRSVLDVFCADGGFGLHTAAGGATHVDMLDSSSTALDRARRNAERNSLADRMSFIEADALEQLGEMAEAGKTYDLIILDPPGFAKSRRQVDQAMKAYQRINITAMQMLSPGGILATSSCSQAVDEADFLKAVEYSVRRSGSRTRTLYRGYQPADHPVLPTMPETHYLKFFVLQKLGDEVPGV
ncbi:MAG: class I SAM-dependent rRNA methyltransferase [Rhodothermales bacterium]